MRCKLGRRVRSNAHRSAAVAITHPDVAAKHEGDVVLGNGRLAQKARVRIISSLNRSALIQKKKCKELDEESAQLHNTPTVCLKSCLVHREETLKNQFAK